MSSSQPSASDKRQYPRFELFEYAIAHEVAGDRSKQVVIVNLGLGGIQLRTRDSFEVGRMEMLEVPSAMMQIPVEVRFCEPVPGSELFSVGMSFKPRRHDERIAIARYVHGVFQSRRDSLTV